MAKLIDGDVVVYTDNEIEALRRLVADRIVYLKELTSWAKLTGMAQQMEKLPLLTQLAEKLGEPDYTKNIYGGDDDAV